jgi:TPR repeat protein
LEFNLPECSTATLNLFLDLQYGLGFPRKVSLEQLQDFYEFAQFIDHRELMKQVLTLLLDSITETNRDVLLPELFNYFIFSSVLQNVDYDKFVAVLEDKASQETKEAFFQALQKLTKQDGQSNFLLGMCYARGLGVEPNVKKGIELYHLAAEQGCAVAQNILGTHYKRGLGVEKNEKKAVEYYRLSTQQGYVYGQYNFGICYEGGIGVEKDEKKAVELFRLAAEQGYANAQNKLCFCYYEGRGVEKDDKKAVELFRLAAEQGYANAQNNLGFCYEKGIGGLNRDVNQAISWYTMAASQGDQEAIKALAHLKYTAHVLTEI